jgi:molybdopterin synthase sulfur carrier subunit
MEVKVYATLRLKIGTDRIAVESGPGATFRDVVEEILQQYPALRSHMMTDDNELSPHVNLFVNGRNIQLLGGLDLVIQEGQQLDIFPPIAGGQTSRLNPSRVCDNLGRFQK